MRWFRRRREIARLKARIADYDVTIAEHMGRLRARIEQLSAEMAQLDPVDPRFHLVAARLAVLRSAEWKIRTGRIDDMTREELDAEF